MSSLMDNKSAREKSCIHQHKHLHFVEFQHVGIDLSIFLVIFSYLEFFLVLTVPLVSNNVCRNVLAMCDDVCLCL